MPSEITKLSLEIEEAKRDGAIRLERKVNAIKEFAQKTAEPWSADFFNNGDYCIAKIQYQPPKDSDKMTLVEISGPPISPEDPSLYDFRRVFWIGKEMEYAVFDTFRTQIKRGSDGERVYSSMLE